MSKFIRNLALFIAGLPLTTTRAAPALASDGPRIDDPSKAISLRPLNLDMNNLFASHRSHSSHSSHRSHASHSSHYSGSGTTYGGGSTLISSETDRTPSTAVAPAGTGTSTAMPASVGTGASAAQPSLSIDEKRRLQIMRVQIKLLSLGLFAGQVNGILDDKTKHALMLFQNLKHLPESGLMTTPTLNALEVPAVY